MIFKYSMGAKVIVELAGHEYVGEIVTRLESHTGGIQYAVYANYKHARQAEWFSESQIKEADNAIS